MQSIKEELQTAIGEVFTCIAEEFDPSNRLFLLKRSGETNVFTIVKELECGALAEHDLQRGQLRITISSADSGLTDEVAQTSFIAYGKPDSTDALEVYGIEPDRRDITGPAGLSPIWTMFATKIANERFTILGA